MPDAAKMESALRQIEMRIGDKFVFLTLYGRMHIGVQLHTDPAVDMVEWEMIRREAINGSAS